jgi:Outer membrane protein beta-barrel domain
VTSRLAVILFLAALPLCAQSEYERWEIGGDIGYGAYHNGTIFSNAGTATAGIRNRFTAGAVICEDLYEHFSCEIRYQYQDGHPFLSSGSVSRDIQGQSHTLTYDALFQIKGRASKIRPFVVAGFGGKYYNTVGPPPIPQPLPAIATLNNVSQWEFVASLGAGVKYHLGEHVVLRGDFRDYLTVFPKSQLRPAPNATARGIFQQFTPMFGVGYVF